MIVQIWTLRRGPLTPHEPLPEEESRRIEILWWEQDHPIEAKHMSFWAESEKIKKTGRQQLQELF